MNDCPFVSYCERPYCDESCPDWAQIEYLMRRNRIAIDDSVTKTDLDSIAKASDILKKAQDKEFVCKSVTSSAPPVKLARLLTYVAICNNWYGSRGGVTVYHLNYSQFIDRLKASWSQGESDEFQYQKIWANNCKVLIISGIDDISFDDTTASTLLNLIDNRAFCNKSTIIICRNATALQGRSSLLSRVKSELDRGEANLR